MSIVDGIRRMVAAGLSYEDALSIAAEFEVAPTPKAGELTARQLRNRRYYEKHRASDKASDKASETVLTPALKASDKASDKASNSDADLFGSRARVEGNNSTQRIEPLVKEVRKVAPKTPRDFLEAVLDADHAGHVIDHRQRIRKPLSPHAADLLARKLGQCDDPNGAADLMIEKGWIGFEPEYWTNRQQPRAGPGGRRMTAAEQTKESLRGKIDGLRQGTSGEGGGHLRLVGGISPTDRKAD